MRHALGPVVVAATIRDIFFRIDDTTGPHIRAPGFDHTASPAELDSLGLLIGFETRFVIEESGSTFKGYWLDASDPVDAVFSLFFRCRDVGRGL